MIQRGVSFGALWCSRNASSPSSSHSLLCLWNCNCCFVKCSHSARQRVYTRKSFHSANVPFRYISENKLGGDRGDCTSYKTMNRLSNQRSQRRLLANTVRSSVALPSAELGGSPISVADAVTTFGGGVGGLGSRLDTLFISASMPFNVALSAVLPFVSAERYSLLSIPWPMDRVGTSSMTNTFERVLRRLSHPILRLIFVKRVYASANVP